MEIVSVSDNFVVKRLLSDSLLISAKKREDRRGHFNRLFCSKELEPLLSGESIVNINHSYSAKKGTLRGLHLQLGESQEGKFIYCSTGSIDDYVVDLRPSSKTYLQWARVKLTHKDENLLFVPKGFAHGFQSTEDDSEIIYFVTQFYSKGNECSVNFLDADIGIVLKEEIAEMSDRDKVAISVKEYEKLA